MSELARVMEWLQGFDGIKDSLAVGHTSGLYPNGIYPKGRTELWRREDILGGCLTAERCSFVLYHRAAATPPVLPCPAEWTERFCRWVERQSRQRLAPTFGNIDIDTEVARAEKGTYHSQPEVGVQLYEVQLHFDFKTYKESE